MKNTATNNNIETAIFRGEVLDYLVNLDTLKELKEEIISYYDFYKNSNNYRVYQVKNLNNLKKLFNQFLEVAKENKDLDSILEIKNFKTEITELEKLARIKHIESLAKLTTKKQELLENFIINNYSWGLYFVKAFKTNFRDNMTEGYITNCERNSQYEELYSDSFLLVLESEEFINTKTTKTGKEITSIFNFIYTIVKYGIVKHNKKTKKNYPTSYYQSAEFNEDKQRRLEDTDSTNNILEILNNTTENFDSVKRDFLIKGIINILGESDYQFFIDNLNKKMVNKEDETAALFPFSLKLPTGRKMRTLKVKLIRNIRKLNQDSDIPRYKNNNRK